MYRICYRELWVLTLIQYHWSRWSVISLVNGPVWTRWKICGKFTSPGFMETFLTCNSRRYGNFSINLQETNGNPSIKPKKVIWKVTQKIVKSTFHPVLWKDFVCLWYTLVYWWFFLLHQWLMERFRLLVVHTGVVTNIFLQRFLSKLKCG